MSERGVETEKWTERDRGRQTENDRDKDGKIPSSLKLWNNSLFCLLSF